MKNIKLFEDFNDLNYDFNVGDEVYCIDNHGVKQELEIGQKYTVDQVQQISPDDVTQIIRLSELGSRWMGWRFTKDPNHPAIVAKNSDLYNL